jgi:hypothetical protein
VNPALVVAASKYQNYQTLVNALILESILTSMRFVLKKATIGIDIAGLKTRKTMLIPAGAVIEITREPVPGGRMLDICWKGKTYLIFAEDIRERGEPLRDQAAD